MKSFSQVSLHGLLLKTIISSSLQLRHLSNTLRAESQSPLMAQQKVVSIAVGESHTLALTGDGIIYSWGRGMFGRLGTGKESDELAPVPVSFDLNETGNPNPGFGDPGQSNPPKFVGIAAGSYHSLALQDDGSLGFGEENSLVPIPIPDLNPQLLSADQNTPTPLKITSVQAGGMMSFAIDSIGSLWMWGHCPDLTLTDSDAFRQVSIPSPVPAWPFRGQTVVKVSCGNEHVLACVTAGELALVLYSWGGNGQGQLGLGDRVARNVPAGVKEFGAESAWEVYEIACGAYHSAVLAQKRTSDEIQCRCWTFGLGDNGQLGHGTTNGSDLPVPVISLPSDIFLISLDCGLFHTAVLSAEGQVWIWGMERGFGLCPDANINTGSDLTGDALNPVRVIHTANGFPNPVQIGCGAAHTVLVSDDGCKMWAWGRGRSGVLGSGVGNDSYTPVLVSRPFQQNQENQEIQENQDLRELSRMEEVTERMEVMERYASLLHVSIFRKAMEERRVREWVCKSGVFDLRREFEGVLERADEDELARMEGFYKGFLESVKEERLRRRVREMVREGLKGELRR
ncbi:hypothetical protein LUZ60_006822 [Juncus effusus]|nr:hypothetical protein LUZ60_006822 [Juncus effusus]